MKKSTLLIFSFIFIGFATNSQIRVACIGNSITYGAGIEHRDSLSYPAQLQRILGAKWDVKNFGVGGATLLRKGNKPYWKLSALTDAMAFNPNIVVIKLGTNDSKPFNWKYKDEFEPNYLSMIDTLQALPARPKIILCLPSKAYGNNWGISDSIICSDIIPMVKKIAKQRKLKVINLYKTMSNHAEMFPDKIHPNQQGAMRIAKRVAKEVRKVKTRQ
ncbi:MAG: hypothetical protein AUK44_07775 [Porphyromonadaceae bacterium CG2_30_38_12]|nr:MAG: hypothetical protein AUK44_07775 [Porphyromonadaceae bacterium CG2_30_38_12]